MVVHDLQPSLSHQGWCKTIPYKPSYAKHVALFNLLQIELMFYGHIRESAVTTPVTEFLPPISMRLHKALVANSGIRASVKSAPLIDLASWIEPER